MTSTIRGKSIQVALALCLALPQLASAAAPAAADIEKLMHDRWDKQAASSTPKSTVTVNAVKIGSTYSANAQDVVDGIPPGADVTAALIDFTVRSYYSDGVEAVRRVREASVYRNKFGVWDVKTGSPRGQDTTTTEPLPN